LVTHVQNASHVHMNTQSGVTVMSPYVGRLSSRVAFKLRCPRCYAAPLTSPGAGSLACESCHTDYGFIDDIPVLIDAAKSLFSSPARLAPIPPRRRLGAAVSRVIPEFGRNWKAVENIRSFREHLRAVTPERPAVLVVGGGSPGEGMQELIGDPSVELVESDVYVGPRTAMVADGHDLPFQDATFDGVVCQAVLEHVLDPWRCVAEIHRVLKPNGVVYAETPFLQQVHLGPYDFTRFTKSGHRFLFREFEELEAGVQCGPGMALAWSIRHFFRSLSSSAANAVFVEMILPFLIFWLKYVDRFTLNKPQTADAACAVYFLGRRSETALEGREIVNYHWSRSRETA
jgi:hypothetical protein